ncbi:hypothetical protein KP509_23G078400 [Ceratopteris richardii]|uniref:Secreted protein n=1 Tax=Ceratopteris richardii TaxID=49495 RepID=A0A8T2S421_CERRI|nr:hypothetical protein KP509_23G078400 [Ceratopteris richardii]
MLFSPLFGSFTCGCLSLLHELLFACSSYVLSFCCPLEGGVCEYSSFIDLKFLVTSCLQQSLQQQSVQIFFSLLHLENHHSIIFFQFSSRPTTIFLNSLCYRPGLRRHVVSVVGPDEAIRVDYWFV